jgi:Competence protein CoiA-like family
MSLVAIVNGVRIVAPFLSDEQWAAIRPRAANIIIPCCNGSGFKRISKNGIRHFVHKSLHPGCQWCTESEEHLRLKRLVAMSCLAAGWQVDLERIGPDWRADVWASNGKTQVAFELQLSPATLDELLDRQRRYQRDGIRCCWFYGDKVLARSSPWDLPRLPTRKDLPAFPLTPHIDETGVDLGPCRARLNDAVRLLLEGKVRFCSRQQIETAHLIEFYYVRCYCCGSETGIYRAGVGVTGCEAPLGHVAIGGMPETDEIDYATKPWIVREVRKFLATEQGRALRVSIPSWQFSPSSQRYYNSFRCCCCNALFGPEYVLHVLEQDLEPSRLIATHVISRQRTVENDPHWCVSETRNFCF